MTQDEFEAIARLRDGDIEGLETLVQLFERQAIRVAFQITANREMAEDVVADAFLTVYDRVVQFDSTRPFKPWFYRIVVNNALKAMARGEKTRSNSDIQLGGHASAEPSPEIEAERHEEHATVIAAIRQLPPKQRATLTLRYYLDMDEATIAKTLGVPRGTVKWRLHAARRQLRSSLMETHAETRTRPEGGVQ